MEQLKRLRKARGLSQAKLAALADLDPSTVSQIETGARRANTRTLERLAAALGAEVADLFPKAQAPLPLEPKAPGLADLDPSTSKLTAAAALEKIAELWSEQLARGYYDRRTLSLMRFGGVYLSSTIESAARDYRETLSPHFRAQLEAAEERFADVWAQLWEAWEALDEAEREHPAPADELAARREARRARREEFLKQMRSGGQALTPGNTA
jgi:transcriptional regulator with XRE-family HTH domain